MALNEIKLTQLSEQIDNFVTSEKENINGAVMRLENLSKAYGNYVAVDKINIEVHEGETIGLIGPNGAGKTTTIKMIANLIRATSGKILVMNKQGELQPLNGISKDLIKFGFLIDVPFFYDMTANQILRFFANAQDYPKEKINDRIDELLRLFKLSDWKHKKVKTFSKGMRQKLGIIQAILVDPQIIILDEPQSGLDPKARIEIRKIIRELQQKGKTIFIASHMLHEISEVCDKIALINHGKIVAFDTIENLEKNLKDKELNCQIIKPIPIEQLKDIIKKLKINLEPYLDIHKIEKEPIKYSSDKRSFTIFYDGKTESRSEILEILISKFKSDFKVISFTQPKTSRLEKIYLEMITDDEPKLNLKKKR